MHRTQGHRVVHREDAVDLGAGVQQLHQRVSPGHPRPGVGIDHQGGVEGQAGRLQPLEVALQSQGGRAHSLVGPGADGRDPAAAPLGQVQDGSPRRLDVAHRDVVDRGAEDPLPQQDEREVHLEQVGLVRLQSERGEQQTVGQPALRALERGERSGPGTAGQLDQHPQVELLCRGDDHVGELAPVRQRQFGDGQPHHAGLTLAQMPCGHVHPVAELGDRRLDPFAGLGPQVAVAVDHVGDSLHRDTGTSGDVAHGHGHAHIMAQPIRKSRRRPIPHRVSTTHVHRCTRPLA